MSWGVEREPQLQRSVFKWVEAADELARESGNKQRHTKITAKEVARKHGVPEDRLRSYIRNEISEAASCQALPFTLLMLGSYTAAVMWHHPVVPVNDVEDSLMFDIEDNANFAFTSDNIGFKGFHDINSHADFWSWMNLGLVPLAFPQEAQFAEGRDENDPAIKARAQSISIERERRGYWLHFNKIIGGIRVRQEAGADATCDSLSLLHSFYNQRCFGTMSGSGYELEPELTTAKYTVDPIKEFWLWANEDISSLLAILKQKEKEAWLDRATTKIEIAIPVFNGNLGVYTIFYVDFFISRGGHIWKRIVPLSTYSQWWHSWYNFVPDFTWCVGLLYIFLTEVFNVVRTLAAKTGGGLRGLRHEYASFWNFVDWATVMGGFWIIAGFAIRFIRTTNMNWELELLSNYNEILEQAAYRHQVKVFMDLASVEVVSANNFRLVLGVYPLLIVFRLFEAFAHQPRLAIVTSTLGDAGVDLVHFLIVFVSIFVTYVIAGVVLFGRQVAGFQTTVRSFFTCFRIMMGDFDWDEMREVGRFEAGFWFSSFIVIIVLLMLNMLLAIVMDAYSNQKETRGESESLPEEFWQNISRWRGERSGKLVGMHQLSRSVRHFKDGDEFTKLTVHGGDQGIRSMSDNDAAQAKAGFAASASSARSSSAYFQPENFVLVTVDALKSAVGQDKLHDEQAMEIIQAAVNEYYQLSCGDTNIEEMCHIIRKVNFTTKRLKRHMQIDLDALKTVEEWEEEKEKEKEKEKAEEDGEHAEDAPSDTMMGQSSTVHPFDNAEDLDSNDLGFAEMLTQCRNALRSSREWIGDEELRDVDERFARHSGAVPMEFVTLTNLDEAVEFSVKRVLPDADAVISACRECGIAPEKDKIRLRAVGRVVRILAKDTGDKTLKVRCPGIGDMWLGLSALCHLKPVTVSAEDAKKKREETTGDSGVSMGSETGLSEHSGDQNKEVLRRIHDLETERRIGQQTVTEAINAVSELKWQQVKEKTDRSKLHQKVMGLRKKLVSRAREHRRLDQESTRLEERLQILQQSRDEYMELVNNMVEEKKKLQERLEKCGSFVQPLALEDIPGANYPDRALGARDLERAKERELALEIFRADKKDRSEAKEDRKRGHRPRDEGERRHRSNASSAGSANSSRGGTPDRERHRSRGERDRSDHR